MPSTWMPSTPMGRPSAKEVEGNELCQEDRKDKNIPEGSPLYQSSSTYGFDTIPPQISGETRSPGGPAAGASVPILA